jgi:hypothetical protein
MISGAMPRLACQAACRSGYGCVALGTVTGHLVHPPARHRTVIPRCGGSLLALMRQTYQLSFSQYREYQAGHATRTRRAVARLGVPVAARRGQVSPTRRTR